MAPADEMQYSDKYFDDEYEYRHVILPKDVVKWVPRAHLLTETEWRNLGVQQSPEWEHYMYHPPEPHVLLFRRPRTDLGGPESKESEINVEQLPDPESEESEGSDESEMDSECLELSKSNNSKMELVEEIRQSWDS